MANYELYYWSVPFRGQFVRAVLAYAGQDWSEHDDEEIAKMMQAPVKKMPVPFMGPPILVDKKADMTLSQMPAIVLYLGETLNLLPASPGLRALTMKVVLDANDVIDEITIGGGRLMWTDKRWEEFQPRLRKWMTLFEETGARNGLEAGSGFMLGEDKPGIADVVTATLWSTMTERFPKLKSLLRKSAPRVDGLTSRMTALPPLAALGVKAKEDYGQAYCGGQIEKSLRKVLDA